MANAVEIIIKATDKASSELKGINKELDQLEDTGKKTANSFERWKGVATTIAGAGAVIAGVGIAAKQAYAVIKDAAALDQTRSKFDNLSDSIGITSDKLLNDLRKATRGMVTDAELVQSATDFMSLGLAKTSDEVTRLTRVAGALGMDMNQLVLTLTNQTTMRFDALGVAVDGFDERLEGLKAQGMDTNEAFTEAFLQQAEAQILKVGEAADTTAGKLVILENKFTNVKENAIQAVLPYVEDFIDDLLIGQQTTDLLTRALNLHLITMEEYREIYSKVGETQESFAEATKDVQTAIENYERSLVIANNEQREFSRGVEEVGYAFASSYSDGQHFAEVMEDIATAQARAANADALSFLEDGWYRAKVMADDAKTAAERYFDSIDRNIASSLFDQLQDIKFEDLGGNKIMELNDAITYAFNNGVPESELVPYMQDAAVAAEQIRIKTGEINADEAANNIANGLNIKLEDAKELLQDDYDIMQLINQLKLSVPIEITVTGRVDLLDAALGYKTYSIPVDLSAIGGERAEGGPVMGGGAYLVGERGPELFVPSTSGYVLNNAQTRTVINGMNLSPTFNITGDNAQSIADEVMARINESYSRGVRSGLVSRK